ncbi:hypothetical protein M3Y99_01378500 [Aphelenchoides fujianensis]|nr:hypothetical protein M3Y99_01378500 [Aphelenchoides fujianensis]
MNNLHAIIRSAVNAFMGYRTHHNVRGEECDRARAKSSRSPEPNGSAAKSPFLTPPLTDESPTESVELEEGEISNAQFTSSPIPSTSSAVPPAPEVFTPPVELPRVHNPFLDINPLVGQEDDLPDRVPAAPLMVNTAAPQNNQPLPGSWAIVPAINFRQSFGRVTFVYRPKNYGLIDGETFFELSVSNRKLKTGDMVRYSAMFMKKRTFQWCAYKVELVGRPQRTKKPKNRVAVSSSSSTAPLNETNPEASSSMQQVRAARLHEYATPSADF